MRSLAEEWEIDDLSVIREHKELLNFLCGNLETGKSKPMKVRRGLRTVAQSLRRANNPGRFAEFIASAVVLLALYFSILISSGVLYHG